MVKTQGPSDYERLDEIITALAAKHGLRLDVSGWTRKTYDVYAAHHERIPKTSVLARVESFATTGGEIRVFDDRAMPFAEELGAALERDFGVAEATVLRLPKPE